MPFDGTLGSNIEALYELKRVLLSVDTDKHKRLNMWNFGINECGTAVCALGWAARDPWFIDRGLRLDSRNNFDAAAEFFRITLDQSRHLFGPALRWWSVPNAIGRIDKVLAELHASASVPVA